MGRALLDSVGDGSHKALAVAVDDLHLGRVALTAKAMRMLSFVEAKRGRQRGAKSDRQTTDEPPTPTISIRSCHK